MDTENIINSIFKSLKAIYPANGYAWDNQEVMDDAKNQWLLAFKENRITQDRLKKVQGIISTFRAIYRTIYKNV